MSQIILSDTPLNEVIMKSSYIIVAQKSKPFVTEKEINVGPLEKKYPPFIEITYHFDIIDVLYYKGDILNEKRINVVPASQVHNFVMHRCYYLGGPVPSVVIGSYKSNVDFDNTDKMILFLVKESENNSFSFTVENSYESIYKKKKIENIIKKNKKIENI